MSNLQTASQFNAETNEFIQKVDTVLNAKRNENPEIHSEMLNFFNLLGKVESKELHQFKNYNRLITHEIPPNINKQGSLSVIYSISSEGSSVQGKSSIKRNQVDDLEFGRPESTSVTNDPYKNSQPGLQFVQKYLQQMQELFNRLLAEKNHLNVQKAVYEIAALYQEQMEQIDHQQREVLRSVMLATQGIDHIKKQCIQLKQENDTLKQKLDKHRSEYVCNLIQPQQVTLNSEFDRIKTIENDLKKSLEQAQSFNDRLAKLLSVKVQEQKYKDNQCKQLQNQLYDLQDNFQDFQTQFLGINTQLKSMFQRIQDLWVYNKENTQTNKIIEDILLDTNKFIDKLHFINSNSDSFQTSINTRSKENTFVDSENLSTPYHQNQSDLSSPFLNNSATKPKPQAKSQQRTAPVASSQSSTLNQFRNHFIVTPQKVSQTNTKRDNSSGSHSYSHRSDNSIKNVSQKITQIPQTARRKEIETLYKEIFKNFK